jgi:hypothetical protein
LINGEVVEISSLGPDGIVYRHLLGENEKNRTDLSL